MNSEYNVPEGKEVRVAISGRSGCGNTTVSRILAETLDIAFINYTFRTLAQELRVPLPEIIERAKTDFTFDRMVDTRQVELARQSSCVLGSRLAIWMLKPADLKVYLTASEEVRCRRIMQREGGDFEEVRRFTAMRDEEDTRRYLELYCINNTDYRFADLVIDTEAKTPETIVGIILDKLVERELVNRG
jgi:cytidylate kinase, putative